MTHMTKEQILAAIKQRAEELRHTPSFQELQRAFPRLTRATVLKNFRNYSQALEETGLPLTAQGQLVPMEQLFRDWAEIVRKLGKLPTMAEYGINSKYSIRPLISRYKSWKQVAPAMLLSGERDGLHTGYEDVLELVRTCLEPAPDATQTCKLTAWPAPRWPVLTGRPIYGTPMSGSALACYPSNELAVVFLFGMLAERLGYVVTRLQAEFPDCEAWRQVGEDKWQLVKAEFEFESRNFLRHMHNPEGCDVIVCWNHNWPECPLEVLELKGWVMKLLNKENPGGDDRG